MFPIKGLVDKDGMDELSIDDFFVNSIFIYPKQNGLINPTVHHPGFSIFESLITLQRGLVVLGFMEPSCV